MFRRDRRKGLSLFVSVLHVSDPELLHATSAPSRGLSYCGTARSATLSELRVVGRQPPMSSIIARPRPKMYRSRILKAADVDYLYSELECLEW